MAPPRLGQLLDEAAARLRAAGIRGARRDARLLLAAAIGVGPAQVLAYPERELSAAQAAEAARLVERRAAREPVSRILGRREFWGLEFLISPETLDPRPDSETLVAAVLARLESRAAPVRILDLGTGSGCLLLALLSELPRAKGLGLDVSAGALAIARANAASLNLAERSDFVQGDWNDEGWLDALSGPWQVIVSNPPYIIGSYIDDLAPEVARFEPRLALDAGPDGLASYRRIVPAAARLLAPEGFVALEIGAGQGSEVVGLIARSGLLPVDQVSDLGGTPRCLIARRPGAGNVSRTGDGLKKVVGMPGFPH